ncbi:MAG: ATP-binding protein [Candidatus Latescibacterota bacterium]
MEEPARRSGVDTEALLGSIVRSIPDIVYRLDAAGRILFINEAVRRYGYDPAELQGTSIFDLIHPEDRAKAAYRLNERRTGERRTRLLEVRLLARNRPPVPFELTQGPWQEEPTLLVSAEGIYATPRPSTATFLCTQGVARDISERKWASGALQMARREAERRLGECLTQLQQAQLALAREAEGRQHLLEDVEVALGALDQCGEMVLCCAADGRVVLANEEACRTLGYRREHLLALRLDQLDSRFAAAHAWQAWWEAVRQERRQGPRPAVLRAADGRAVAVETVATFLEVGQRPRVCCCARPAARAVPAADLASSLPEAQATRTMEAIGQLAGGVAHHFNNMLQGITGNLYLAQLDAPAGLQEYLAAAQSASDRAAEMVRQLMVFAGRGIGLRRDVVQIDVLLRQAVALSADARGPRLSVELDLPPGPVPAVGDEGYLLQAVTNLLRNAREAIEDAGRTQGTIRVALQTGLELTGVHRPGPGGWVRVQVQDDGVGMDPGTAGRVFEPFFTTKPVGRGTGMGLAVVWAIARACGGWVDCSSQRGQGTCVSLYLAAAPEPVETP